MTGEMRTEKAVLALINLIDGTAMNQLQKKSAAEFVGDAAAALQGKRTGTIRQGMGKVLGSQFKLLEVQYNPASMHLSANGPGISMENAQTEGDGNIIQQRTKPISATLSMDLIVAGEKTGTKIGGMLGMLGNDLTRQVIFCWGDMVFPGEVTGLSASYSMFSPAGDPWLGKIALTIYQESQEESEYWKKALRKVFPDGKNR